MTSPQTWTRFRRSKLAMFALVYVALMTLIALLAPVWRLDPYAIDLAHRLAPPDAAHVLGTDELGRDILARMMFGARVSLAVGFFATLISVVVGSFFGAIAGYYGRAADWVVSRLIEIVLCFPFLFLVLGIVALFRPSLATIMIALGLTTWTNEARYVRAEFLRIRELEFAQAARASGARDARIIFRHLLPNLVAPIIVYTTLLIPTNILFEAALSFLGVGVQPPTASWGAMIADAIEIFDTAWWYMTFPGVALLLTVLAFNLVGDGLQDALNPRTGR